MPEIKRKTKYFTHIYIIHKNSQIIGLKIRYFDNVQSLFFCLFFSYLTLQAVVFIFLFTW